MKNNCAFVLVMLFSVAGLVNTGMAVQAPTIPTPTAGFTISIPVTLAQALDIHAVLIDDSGPVPPASVQAGVERRITNYLQELVNRGKQVESRGIEEKYRQLSAADKAAIKAEIAKRLKVKE